MRDFIRKKIREKTNTLVANSNTHERNICDDFSVNTFEELIELLRNTHIPDDKKERVKELLNGLKQTNDYLSNDLDNFDTTLHQIASMLCR